MGSLTGAVASQKVEARVAGYRGLIAHLQGDFKRARVCYDDAIQGFDQGPGNSRAQSKFLQHWGDMMLASGDLEEARRTIEQAWAEAETEGHYDLVGFAQNSLGHYFRITKDYIGARAEYDRALSRAREMGIRKLEADVMSELSRLSLDLGDTETALRRAARALRIANEFGLGLRHTHALVILGLATVRAGHIELGRGYLLGALREAEEQGYHLRRREAEEALYNLSGPRAEYRTWLPGGVG